MQRWRFFQKLEENSILSIKNIEKRCASTCEALKEDWDCLTLEAKSKLLELSFGHLGKDKRVSMKSRRWRTSFWGELGLWSVCTSPLHNSRRFLGFVLCRLLLFGGSCLLFLLIIVLITDCCSCLFLLFFGLVVAGCWWLLLVLVLLAGFCCFCSSCCLLVLLSCSVLLVLRVSLSNSVFYMLHSLQLFHFCQTAKFNTINWQLLYKSNGQRFGLGTV